MKMVVQFHTQFKNEDICKYYNKYGPLPQKKKKRPVVCFWNWVLEELQLVSTVMWWKE